MKVVSVIGHKKAGKTQLIEKLIPKLKEHGTVAVIKHIHTELTDAPGTDTHRIREAGADIVIGATEQETVKIAGKQDLEQLLGDLADDGVDFTLVEGYKETELSKIAIGDIQASNIVVRVPADQVDHVNLEELVEVVSGTDEWVTLTSLINQVRRHPDLDQCGAIVTFTGIVRGISDDGKVTALEFERYDEVAAGQMQSVIEDLRSRDGIVEVLIHHKIGHIKTGEDIIYIVVAGGHRQDVFPVLSEAIERVKAEVSIWKKEISTAGEHWVQPDQHTD